MTTVTGIAKFQIDLTTRAVGAGGRLSMFRGPYDQEVEV